MAPYNQSLFYQNGIKDEISKMCFTQILTILLFNKENCIDTTVLWFKKKLDGSVISSSYCLKRPPPSCGKHYKQHFESQTVTFKYTLTTSCILMYENVWWPDMTVENSWQRKKKYLSKQELETVAFNQYLNVG